MVSSGLRENRVGTTSVCLGEGRGVFLLTHPRAHFYPSSEPSFNPIQTAGWTLVSKVQGIKEGPGVGFGDSGISEAFGRDSRWKPS